MIKMFLVYDENAEPVRDKDMFTVAQSYIDKCVDSSDDNYIGLGLAVPFSNEALFTVFRLLLTKQRLVEKLDVEVLNKQTGESCKMNELGNIDNWDIVTSKKDITDVYRELLILQSKIRLEKNNI